MEVNIVDIAPGFHSGEPIQHGPGEIIGLVFEGKLKLTVDGKAYNVEPGDSFAFSYDRPHSFGNAGKRKTRALFVLAPPVDFASRSRAGKVSNWAPESPSGVRVSLAQIFVAGRRVGP